MDCTSRWYECPSASQYWWIRLILPLRYDGPHVQGKVDVVSGEHDDDVIDVTGEDEAGGL